MSPDLARARAALLAPVLPLMRNPAAAATLEELRFAVRRRQQEDLRLAQVYWDELMEWVHARRRGFKKKLTAYRRFITDLVRIHAAERLAWGIPPDADIFDGLRAQWKTEAMIRETMTLLRDAARRADERAAARETARRDGPAGPAEPVCTQEMRAGSGEDDELAETPAHMHIPDVSQDGLPPAVTESPDLADRSPFGASARPRPRPHPESAAAMGRFTRENPMIPPPPAIFVRGRFGGGVPTFDPHAAIQEYKRKEALGLHRF